MKYFRNACSTLSTRSAWPWRDGVHIIYVTVHFTHTNATQHLLMLWQFVLLQHSHKGLGIHCCCWSRKKKRSPVPMLTFTVVFLQVYKHSYSNCLLPAFGHTNMSVLSFRAVCHHQLDYFNQWPDILSRVPEQVLLHRRSKKKILQKEEEKTFTTEQVRTDIPSFCPSNPSLSIIPYFTDTQLDFKGKKNKASINN